MMRMSMLVLGGLAAAGGAAYVNRQELRRYLMMQKMDSNPSLVGESVTPQGNTMALGRSETERQRRRVVTPPNMEPSMPTTNFAGQGH
jgi:hypothetical protein